MTLEELKVKYRWVVDEAYYRGNVDTLDKLYVPEVTIHQAPFPDIKGLEAYKQYILAARQAYTDIQFD